MLTTMTTAENLGFSSPFFAHSLNFVGGKQSCFKMKTEQHKVVEERSPAITEEQLDVADLLERIGLEDIDYDEASYSDQEWCFPGTECTERASRHLSGGGLLTENCATPTLNPNFVARRNPQPSMSSLEVTTSQCTNPFKNDMRLVLEAEDDDESCVFCSTNPFSNFDESSLSEEVCAVKRTPSQCSTRVVSPSRSYPLFPIPRPNSFIFALPAPPTVSQATQTAHEPSWLFGDGSEKDLKCLQESIKALQLSGWYYGNVSWKDSIILLQDTQPGTFFVRDSADPNFLFSLSVQTVRGPTSVRIHYINSRFRLDAESKLIPRIPSFNSVIELVEYYIENTDSKRRSNKLKGKATKEQVWVDPHGQIYSNIILSKPLLKNGQISQLQHLCRLQLNSMLRHNFRNKYLKSSSKRHLPNHSIPVIKLVDSLSLPHKLLDYLREYPFSK